MITQHYLKTHLNYNPETGVFTWIKAARKPWLNGTEAGSVKTLPGGYQHRMIGIGGGKYLAHRLAFLYMTGSIPDEVDHRDRDSLNNSWSNLRPSTRTQNCANTSNRKTALPKGVRKHRDKYQATIGHNYKTYPLGTFSTPEEAHAAYMEAARTLHGEYACSG